MSSLTEEWDKDEKELDRIASYIENEDRNMKDFSDFSDALNNAFNKKFGSNILTSINDIEQKMLFNSSRIRDLIKNNVGEKEYTELYQNLGNYEVIRRVPKGEKTRVSDLKTIEINKDINAKAHFRSGKMVNPYSRSLNEWTPAQEKYLKSLREKNISNREIVYKYNRQFASNNRTSASIKSKINRLK